MQLATAQINAATNVCHAVVFPMVQALTPKGEYWVVIDLDATPAPTGKVYTPQTGAFA